MKKLLSVVLVVMLGAGYAGSLLAQAKPEVLVKQRQSAMTLIGKYWGPLGGMAQGKVPYNADVVKRNAGYLNALSEMPWDGFHANTKDVQSRALSAVYNDSDKFKQAGDRFKSEVDKLVQVSTTGDEAAVKAQLGAVGKSCGGCHEDFREKR